MKFYYNGELIRTSKTHVYTHAVITTEGKCAGCRNSKEAAESIITSEIGRAEQSIKNSRNKIKAMEAGKKMYSVVEGRRRYYMPIEADDSVENTQGWIDGRLNWIEHVKNNWKVVELEAR